MGDTTTTEDATHRGDVRSGQPRDGRLALATGFAALAGVGNVLLGVLGVLVWDGGDLFERLATLLAWTAETTVLERIVTTVGLAPVLDPTVVLVPPVVGFAIATALVTGVACLVGAAEGHRDGYSLRSIFAVCTAGATGVFTPFLFAWAVLSVSAWYDRN